MKSPEIPQDEQARMQTLKALNILDTLPEERFDRLTRMAKKLFNVPIALFSIVDENRQWFKAIEGLNASETPRNISFCGHAILGDDVFIVPNAKEDERFADNPLVTDDPKIRYYAGCPIRTANGHKVGTLCVIDKEPRSLIQEDIETLKDLATMVEQELVAFQMATSDELTKISNRRGFMKLAEYSLNLCARQKIKASLVFLDLDKFKSINDTFGHAEGDKVLIVFADHMKHMFRGSDIFARLGGDEFTVLLTNTSKKQAEEVIALFAQSIQRYNNTSNNGYDILFSHGIVEYQPRKHSSVEDLLADGDALMYQVKGAKKR